MGFINHFFIKINSKKIGIDEFGNEYFEKKNGKRFVIYNGKAEATKIPFEWQFASNLLPKYITVSVLFLR